MQATNMTKSNHFPHNRWLFVYAIVPLHPLFALDL